MKKMRNLIAVILSGFLVMKPLEAELVIDVTSGRIEPMPIAVTDFYGATPHLAELGAQLTKIISDDLESCGLFKPLDKMSFIQSPAQLRDHVRHADWRLINAQTLVRGEVRQLPDGRLRVEFRLFDVISEKQMEGLAFPYDPRLHRRIAHKIADAIYKRVTGDEGYFDTRIVYVSQTGPLTNTRKRLAIMDQDGANPRLLSSGDTSVLTPRFSPNGQEIAYLEFSRQRNMAPHVYRMQLSSLQRQLVGNFKGMTFAPQYSPDGKNVVMSFAAGGRTSLYKMNMITRTVQRLTDSPLIDTSPCYSPDGTKIVFNSDRGGKPQLYVMSADGGEAERISFGQGRYMTPVWSPRGDLIAFTKQNAGTFYIGVMRPDGTGERLIAQGYVVEDPCWSPNGRVIMFTRMDRSGKSKIYSVDIAGYNERMLPTPAGAEARGPSWSPPLN